MTLDNQPAPDLKNTDVEDIGVYTRDGELPDFNLPNAPLAPTARRWRVVAHRTAQAAPGTCIMESVTPVTDQ